jgi:hypothetical protein
MLLCQDIRIARGGNLGDLDSGSTPEPPPEAPKDLDPSLISASQASLEKLAGAARSSLDALMLSDVPLMAPPGMVSAVWFSILRPLNRYGHPSHFYSYYDTFE